MPVSTPNGYRAPSTIIQSDDELSRQLAALQAAASGQMTPQQMADSMIRENAQNQATNWWHQAGSDPNIGTFDNLYSHYSDMVANPEAYAANYGGINGVLQNAFGTQDRAQNYLDWINGGAQGAQQAYAAQNSALTGQQQQRRDQRQNLQSAYDTQTLGGGVFGGILPGFTSAAPSGNGAVPVQTDPNNPNMTMPYSQPWGTPGFGGNTGGASIGSYSANGGLGGLGGFQGGQPAPSNSAGNDMGGPFSVRNPWSVG